MDPISQLLNCFSLVTSWLANCPVNEPCQSLWQYWVQFQWFLPPYPLQADCPVPAHLERVIVNHWGSLGFHSEYPLLQTQMHLQHKQWHQAATDGITCSSLINSGPGCVFNSKYLLPVCLRATTTEKFFWYWYFANFITIYRFLSMFISANSLVIFSNNSCSLDCFLASVDQLDDINCMCE